MEVPVFGYWRLTSIAMFRSELAELNTEVNDLMNQIQGVEV
jgi:hypothetical protein